MIPENVEGRLWLPRAAFVGLTTLTQTALTTHLRIGKIGGGADRRAKNRTETSQGRLLIQDRPQPGAGRAFGLVLFED